MGEHVIVTTLKKRYGMTDEDINKDGRHPAEILEEKDIKQMEREYALEHGRTAKEDGVEFRVNY